LRFWAARLPFFAGSFLTFFFFVVVVVIVIIITHRVITFASPYEISQIGPILACFVFRNTQHVPERVCNNHSGGDDDASSGIIINHPFVVHPAIHLLASATLSELTFHSPPSLSFVLAAAVRIDDNRLYRLTRRRAGAGPRHRPWSYRRRHTLLSPAAVYRDISDDVRGVIFIFYFF
jgi:hypothetical protein